MYGICIPNSGESASTKHPTLEGGRGGAMFTAVNVKCDSIMHTCINVEVGFLWIICAREGCGLRKYMCRYQDVVMLV